MQLELIPMLIYLFGWVLWIASHHLNMTKTMAYKYGTLGIALTCLLPQLWQGVLGNMNYNGAQDDRLIIAVLLFYTLNIVSIIIGLLRRPKKRHEM